MPKKPKKILIFEGDKVNVENFLKFCQNKDYVYTIVSDEITSSDFLDSIEKIVEKEKPDYVIIGNVRGFELDVARRISMDKKRVIVYARSDVVKKARDSGHVAYTKHRNLPLEKIFEYISEH